MINYIQPGDIVTLIAPATVSSGDGFVVGTLFGVAVRDAASGADVDARITGVLELPKAAGAITQGAAVYWDNTAKNVTTTATGNTLIGAAVLAASSGAATARIRLKA